MGIRSFFKDWYFFIRLTIPKENEAENLTELLTYPPHVEKMLNGTKTQVRLREQYGDPGDTFSKQGTEFVITKVYRQKFGDLSKEELEKEGYGSMDEYRRTVKKLHPYMKLLPDRWLDNQYVWVHEFKAEG